MSDERSFLDLFGEALGRLYLCNQFYVQRCRAARGMRVYFFRGISGRMQKDGDAQGE